MAPKKRKQPEPTEDDILIKELEAKLGLTGDSKKRKALINSIQEEEFGGEPMMAFLDSIIDDKPLDDFFDDSELEELGAPTRASRNKSDVETVDKSEDQGSSPGEEESEDDDSQAEQSESEGATSDCQEAVSENAKKKVAAKLAAGKYVPAILRKAAASQSEKKNESLKSVGLDVLDWSSLRQALRSLFNRASEGNLSVVLADFQNVLTAEKEKLGLATLVSGSASTEDVKTEFVKKCGCVMAEAAFECFKNRTSARLLSPQMAIVVALSHVVNRRVLLMLLTDVISGILTTTLGNLKAEDKELAAVSKETCRFLLMGLCILCVFDGISGSLLASVLREMMTVEKDAGELYGVAGFALRLVGPGLKDSDPESLASITKIYSELRERLDADGSSMKSDFLTQDLERVGERNELHQKLMAMRNWLRTLRGTVAVVYEPGEPDSVIKIVLNGENLADVHNTDQYIRLSSEVAKSDVGPNHVATAKSIGIKAPFQIQVFCAMMEADGVEDAVARLIGFANNKKKLVPHIIALILHCAVHQRVYNPFYEELLTGLATIGGKRYKVAIRQGVHSVCDILASIPKRKAILAKICMDLAGKGVLFLQESLVAKLNASV